MLAPGRFRNFEVKKGDPKINSLFVIQIWELFRHENEPGLTVRDLPPPRNIQIHVIHVLVSKSNHHFLGNLDKGH